jgi:hypothetical protein
MRNITSFVMFVFLIFCTEAYAVPSDFDADGISDHVYVEIENDDSLTWKAVLSDSGSTSTLGSLGVEGNELAMAQWLGTGTQIGVVSEETDGEGLVWSILNDSDVQVDKVFGKKGDLAVAGADFNGNGIADAAVVRLVNGRARWEIALDLFNEAEPQTISVRFGKTGDRAFFARADESGLDSIAIMRAARNGARSVARLKNLMSGEVQRVTRMPRYASQGSRPRAFPVQQVSGADLLAFQRNRGSTARIIVFSQDGTRVKRDVISGADAISVVGEFNQTSPGLEIGVQGSTQSVIISPTTNETITDSFAGGVAVDEINLNVVGDSSSGDAPSECSTITAWPSTHIYKTIGSTHFSPGDVRRNTVGLILKPGTRGPFPSCIDAIDTAGSVVAKLGLYQRGNGWAARYYAGIGCGTSTAYNGKKVATRAQANTGSKNIYMKFGTACYGPIDASQCQGSSQC